MKVRLLLVWMVCAACGDDDVLPRVDAAVTEDAGPDAPSECDEGDPCDADGDGCTTDVCRGGVCEVGAPADCDDGVSCTTDACVSMGAMRFECEHDVAARSCVIDSMCRMDGDVNPTNGCQRCDANMSERMWTATEGECDDGDACTMGDTCASGTCEGTPLLDAFEDNNDRGDAARLMEVNDRSTFPAGTIEGTLYPDGDEDYYVYLDTDSLGGRIFPRVELQDIPSGSNFDLCAFISCTEGATNKADCTRGIPTMLGTLPGCCSMAADNLDEVVRIDHDCSGGNDSADVIVRVTSVSGPAVCDSSYSLLYGDN